MPHLKFVITLFLFIISFHKKTLGQTHTITGLVIGGDFDPVPSADITTTDHKSVGKTSINGRFTIVIPDSTNILIFRAVGYENSITKLDFDCNTMEVIMLLKSTYDFMSPKEVDKLRLKQFKTLSRLHVEAFNKGIFTNNITCYSTEFQSQKARMDSIRKERSKQKKRAARPPAFEKN